MKLLHGRSGKQVVIHNPLMFLAQDRETAEEHPAARAASEEVTDEPDERREAESADDHRRELHERHEPERLIGGEAEPALKHRRVRLVHRRLTADLALDDGEREKRHHDDPVIRGPLKLIEKRRRFRDEANSLFYVHVANLRLS